VVFLAANSAGRVTTVDVQESPDPEIRRAVERAGRTWRFLLDPPPAGHSGVTGKVILYFRIVNGRGEVHTAQQLLAIQARSTQS